MKTCLWLESEITLCGKSCHYEDKSKCSEYEPDVPVPDTEGVCDDTTDA